MLTKPRKDLRTVIGLLTVHNVPASHASGMSISNMTHVENTDM